MISEAIVSQQIVRLSILRGEKSEAAIAEVKQVYREAAKNPAHATRMTNWIIRHLDFFPVPREVFTAASEEYRAEESAQPDKHCKACGGTGFEQAWQLVTYHANPDGSAFKQVDVIRDPEVAADLRAKVDGKTQFLYPCVDQRGCTKCGRNAALKQPA
jgi:hypothetical protein